MLYLLMECIACAGVPFAIEMEPTAPALDKGLHGKHDFWRHFSQGG